MNKKHGSMLDNLRQKYALSSFPSQMSRVKVEWCKFGERHEDFFTSMETVYAAACSPESGCSKRAVKELKQYIKDDMIEQMKKWRAAKSPGVFSGNTKRVREKIPCEALTNSQINSRYSHKLGDAAKKIGKCEKSYGNKWLF